jgi:hypothetical protein
MIEVEGPRGGPREETEMYTAFQVGATFDEPHVLAKGLTEWSCSCGRYGVLLTAADRDAKVSCK